jgi:hypothetical protein
MNDMKRDMDLVRQVLLQIEAAPYGGAWIELSLPDHSDEEVTYHIKLLAEASLIEAINLSSHGNLVWQPQCLTWAGHEFLEAARDESRWKKAKSMVLEKSGGMLFSVLKDVLVKLVGQAVLGS